MRNLHFAIISIDLFAAFSPCGAIQSIDIPIDNHGKGRGFAFVWFIHQKSAELALKRINGKLLYPGFGAERIKEGGEGKKQTRQRLKKEGEELKDQGRPVAVDWAVSKDQFENAQQQAGDEKAASSSSNSNDTKADVVQEVSGDSSEEDFSAIEDNPIEEDSDEEVGEDYDGDSDITPVQESEEENSVTDNNKQKQKDVGTTLFVRNVQFEATEDELYTLCVFQSCVFSIHNFI